VVRRKIHPLEPNHLGEMFHGRENRAGTIHPFVSRSVSLSAKTTERIPLFLSETGKLSMARARETRFVA
jgi:hypothetical protein